TGAGGFTLRPGRRKPQAAHTRLALPGYFTRNILVTARGGSQPRRKHHRRADRLAAEQAIKNAPTLRLTACCPPPKGAIFILGRPGDKKTGPLEARFAASRHCYC